MNCLQILDINPLSVALFEKISLYSVGWVFILLMVSFSGQKLLSLIRSYFVLFVFISITLGDGSKINVLLDYCAFISLVSKYFFFISSLISSVIHWLCSILFILLFFFFQFSCSCS